MTVQRARAFAVAVGDGSGGFLTLAGLAGRELAFDTLPIEAAAVDGAGRWRLLVPGAALRRARVVLDGLFTDAPSDVALQRAFADGAARPWRITLPSFAVVDGSFQIVALTYGADPEGKVSWRLVAESAGPLVFVPI